MRISDWSSDVCSSDLTFVPSLIETPHLGVIVIGLGMKIRPNIFLDTISLSMPKRPDDRPVACPLSVIPGTNTPGGPPPESGRREEEHRGVKECVSTWRIRWSQKP